MYTTAAQHPSSARSPPIHSTHQILNDLCKLQKGKTFSRFHSKIQVAPTVTMVHSSSGSFQNVEDSFQEPRKNPFQKHLKHLAGPSAIDLADFGVPTPIKAQSSLTLFDFEEDDQTWKETVDWVEKIPHFDGCENFVPSGDKSFTTTNPKLLEVLALTDELNSLIKSQDAQETRQKALQRFRKKRFSILNSSLARKRCLENFNMTSEELLHHGGDNTLARSFSLPVTKVESASEPSSRAMSNPETRRSCLKRKNLTVVSAKVSKRVCFAV